MCVVIADTVAAYREIALLRLALSLTASLPYLPPTFQNVENRLGKHDVAVSPKLSGLIIIPTGALIFSVTAFEDVSAISILRTEMPLPSGRAGARPTPMFAGDNFAGRSILAML